LTISEKFVDIGQPVKGFTMNKFILIIFFCLATTPAFANAGGVPNGGVGHLQGHGNHLHEAPAPLIGYGLPSLVALGAGLIAARLFRRARR
jgi:hypothetical protein